MKFIIASCLAILPLLVIEGQAKFGFMKGLGAVGTVVDIAGNVADLIPTETKEEDSVQPKNHNAAQPDGLWVREYPVVYERRYPGGYGGPEYDRGYPGGNGRGYPGRHRGGHRRGYPGGHRGGFRRGYPAGYGGDRFDGGEYGGGEYGGGGYRRRYPPGGYGDDGYVGRPRQQYNPLSFGKIETVDQPIVAFMPRQPGSENVVPFADERKQDSDPIHQPENGDHSSGEH